MSLKSIFGATFVALGLVACGGDLGTDTRRAPAPETPSSTPASTFTAADVQAATAQCSAPHGDLGYSVGMLSRTWLYCPREGARGPDIYDSADRGARVGLELTADGHFYWLSRNEGGVVARGQGITEVAGYEITAPSSAPVNNVSFQIDVIYPSGSIMGTRATFETGPRRLALQGFSGMFVPLTATTATTSAAP
jgi:hypothetical protein